MTAALIDSNPSPAQIVSVLGMHRCGSSVVARLLNLLGVHLGPAELLIKPGFDNPKGFWEHRELTQINEQILSVFGGDHLHPPTLPEDWEYSPMLRELKLRAQEIIERDLAGPRVWGWKDPRTSLTLSFWQQLLPEMKYVICLRNPVDVGRSLEIRNDLPFAAGAELWLRYARTALKHTSKWPHIIVFYEDVMEKWREQSQRLSYFVFGQDRTENERFRNALQEFLDERLRHHCTTVAGALSNAKVPFAAKALFLTLRLAVNNDRSDSDALREPELESGSVRSRQENPTRQSSGRAGIQDRSAVGVFHLRSPGSVALAPDRELQRDPLAITFVSHDARRAGAPRVLLTLIEWLRQKNHVEPRVILRRGGPLIEEFRRLGPVFEVESLSDRGWDEINSGIVNFCRGSRLIYVNTLVPGDIAEALTALKVPIVVHAHEMDYAIQNSCNPIHLEALLGVTDQFIAASSTVADNLCRHYDVSPERIQTVREFIGPVTNDSALQGTAASRRERQLPEKGFIVFGCGTADWRKAPDLFVEVARIALIELNLRDVYFYWIGAETEGFDLRYLKGLVNQMGLEKHVQFLGELEDPGIYFAAGDVFLLTSREDPFPLVCLEAADQGLPIFCFDKAGSMPEFVRNDAGYVAPFADAQAMADKLAWLYANADENKRLGSTARTRVREDHTASKGAELIWQFILQLAMLPNAELSAAKTERLRMVLRAERATREVERVEFAKQISELATQRHSAETYAKSMEDENQRLQEAIEAERVARQAESTQAVKQASELAEWGRSAERYAKSMEDENRRLQETLEADRVAREAESVQVAQQISELTHWGRSAEHYAKSQEDENRRLREALVAERACREIEGSEASTQATALTERVRSVEVYAKSVEEEVERLQIAYRAESAQRETEAVNAVEKIRSVETELGLYKNHWLLRLMRRFNPRKYRRKKITRILL